MASHAFNYGKAGFAGDDLHPWRPYWPPAGIEDIDVHLLMTNTTAATDYEAERLTDLGTVDEFDGSGYFRIEATSQAVEVTGAPGVGYCALHLDDVTWTGLGPGTRAIKGAVVLYRTQTSYDPLMAWIEFTTPITANGGDFTINWHADGVIKFGFNP